LSLLATTRPEPRVSRRATSVQQREGSEGGDGEDLEDIEIVVLGGAREADASLDAGTEGKSLERGPRCAAIEVL